MSGVQQRLKLKQTPIDTWSLKEHLTLASAVLKWVYIQCVNYPKEIKQINIRNCVVDVSVKGIIMTNVFRNGDQNWVSVSRTMKQLGEGGRPSDW